MHDFTLVILDGAYGSAVSATLDLLDAAARLAPRVAAPSPTWRVCSLDGGPVRLQSGLLVDTRRLPRHARADRSTWIVPGLSWTTEPQVLAGLDGDPTRRLVPLLRAHVRRGGRVAACCSAVFLLQAAGLLSGRRATTTWWLAPLLQRLSPDSQVDASRMVCDDGPVATGGAAFAQTDLMLHLLRRHGGAALVERLSSLLMLDAREAQSPAFAPELLAGGDALVARLVDRVQRALPQAPSVAELAREFCMSERTLGRHVRRVTGQGTLALLNGVRLQRARALLQHSRLSIEQVAQAVGYDDPTALRRLMRRATGARPSQYRPAVAVV